MTVLSQLAIHPFAPIALLVPALFCAYQLRLLQIELNRDEIHLQQVSRHDQLMDLGLRMALGLAALGLANLSAGALCSPNRFSATRRI